MAKNICITEEQYRMALKEGVLPNSNGKFTVNANQYDGNGNNPEKNVTQTMNDLKQKYPNAEKDFQVVGDKGNNSKTQVVSKDSTNNTLSENKLITKKKLQENRLKKLKENSEIYTVKDFLKNIKK